MSTIREMIEECEVRLRDPDTLFGDEAARILVKLSSLLASVNTEVVAAEFVFNQKKRDLLAGSDNNVSRAKVLAEATEEWKSWKERVLAGKSCEEMIKSLKYLIRNLEEEKKLMPNK